MKRNQLEKVRVTIEAPNQDESMWVVYIGIPNEERTVHKFKNGGDAAKFANGASTAVDSLLLIG